MMAPGGIGSLFEAPEPSVIGTAMEWCLSLVSGSLVTAIATVAVAGIGFALLAGRVPVRRAVMVVIGIFLMAGAGSIHRVGPGVGPNIAPSPVQLKSVGVVSRSNETSPHVLDPYAGASISAGRPGPN